MRASRAERCGGEARRGDRGASAGRGRSRAARRGEAAGARGGAL